MNPNVSQYMARSEPLARKISKPQAFIKGGSDDEALTAFAKEQIGKAQAIRRFTQ